MSVRQPLYAVLLFPEHFSGTYKPTFMMIFSMWVVFRAKVAYAEFWACHMLIKYLIRIIYSKELKVFLSVAYLGNRMPNIDCVWYTGARAEGAHALFWAWHMLVPGTAEVRNVTQCSMTIKLSSEESLILDKMMVTFTEVKGHQRSNVVPYVL